MTITRRTLPESEKNAVLFAGTTEIAYAEPLKDGHMMLRRIPDGNTEEWYELLGLAKTIPGTRQFPTVQRILDPSQVESIFAATEDLD